MSVFHLKYRPVKFSDLDLADVAETLKKILQAKDIPQSFLFSGPKGAGKTSAARILAKAVNCLNLKDGEPCGECENCKEIEKGNSLDIIEIDAASNRGIDDIRSLKDKAYLLPSRFSKKVFIIDEVHMLTKDAFNALLKLIEEPPKHTIFILCTTDAEKIPETVLSRLIKIDFRKGEKKELLNSLKKIIKGEKIEIDEETINFVLEKSDGSFRNLQRTFNEIYLQLGDKLGFSEVKDFFGSKSGGYNETNFEMDLSEGKTKVILEKLEKMANDGVDFSLFLQNLISYFQKKLLNFFGIGINKNEGLNLNETEFFINLLIKAAKQEKDVEIEQLPLELAVVDFCLQKNGGKVKEQEIKPETKKEEKIEEIKIVEELKEPVIAEVTVDEEEIFLVVDNSNVNLGLEQIEEKWGNLLMAVKPFNHSVEAFLRAARPSSIKGKNLTLEVFYPFHKERLEEIKNRKIVEDGLTKVFGKDLCFDCVLGKSKKEALVIKNDTPVESISNELISKSEDKNKDIYDVAKEIFG